MEVSHEDVRREKEAGPIAIEYNKIDIEIDLLNSKLIRLREIITPSLKMRLEKNVNDPGAVTGEPSSGLSELANGLARKRQRIEEMTALVIELIKDCEL